MANPSVRRSIDRDRRSGQAGLKPLPLVTRRFAAWTVEVSLIVTSALVPFGIGMYAKFQPEQQQVPLNRVLIVTKDAIAKTLALPAGDSNHDLVAPLTNLFWSAALVAPIVLSSWQLYLLGKTGKTLPKRWFGVKVVTATGKAPGMLRVLLREGVGCWGLPLSIAYLLWRYSGAFPSLSILSGLAGLMVLGEGMSARFHRQRRCLHDHLAGTYVVDANRPLQPFLGRLSGDTGGIAIKRETPNLWKKPDVREKEQCNDGAASGFMNGAISNNSKQVNAAIVSTSELTGQRGNLWLQMRRNPAFTLLLVTVFSMAAVLATLVGTQVYIQTQANQREFKQQNSEQFLALVKQLSLNSPATLEERRGAILALGTLNDPKALQLLVDFLGQETDQTLLDAIQQALASTGTEALPYLQRLNQSFSNELQSLRYSGTAQERALPAQRLHATKRAIAKILVIYSGKVHTVDLSRTELGQANVDSVPFTLVLDKIDLSGIKLRAANLNNASFRGSRWRGVGEDGRWDTFDDAIADLSDAQMQQANLTGANLSRVLMNRTNLSRATLNQANLSLARLSGANLSSTQLLGANMHQAVLTSSSLTGADLGEAVLTQANLYAARLSRVSALGTQLQLANLSKSDWQGADLSGADLNGANLRNANFSATRLTGANFRNAQMKNVNLRNADLNLADLRGADLAGADLQGAIFISSKPYPADQFIQMPVSDWKSALVKGVDFTKAKNLDVKQLAYICTQGGRHPRCP